MEKDHQNDSTERVLKEAESSRTHRTIYRPSKRLDRASTERPGEEAIFLAHSHDHQNDSTERVLKGTSSGPRSNHLDDHQNDSTERVLKESRQINYPSPTPRPSKRLDRASTESVGGGGGTNRERRPSKRLDRASTERVAISSWMSSCAIDHQNDSAERVLKAYGWQ